MSEVNAVAEAQEAIEETPVTEEAVDQTETDDGGDAGQEKEAKKERPSRARDRIQELAADKRAAIEYAELQRQRADELEQRLAANTPAVSKERPKLSDFETPDEWADAVTDWSVNQAASKAQQAMEKRLADKDNQTTQSKREAEFQASLEAASAKHEDYWDVALDESATYLNGQLLETVKDLPDSGELVYFLNSNPTQARKIAAMTPARMAAELGRIGGTMSTPKPKPKTKVTEAPEPPAPVGGGSATELDLTKLSTKDYIATRREQRRKANKR